MVTKFSIDSYKRMSVNTVFSSFQMLLWFSEAVVVFMFSIHPIECLHSTLIRRIPSKPGLCSTLEDIRQFEQPGREREQERYSSLLSLFFSITSV